MAGHHLTGAQSQAILCCPGEVVQQAQSHCCVQFPSYTVVQFLSAAGELEREDEIWS